MDLLFDILYDAVKDTLVLVPFLLVTYLALEALEHMAGSRLNAAVRRAGAAGPVVGAILGIFPQCGFSAMGATLYAGRVITVGTLMAVFLSTSDEMLPLLVAEQVSPATLGSILVSKAIIGLMVGLAVDAVMRVVRARPAAHERMRALVLRPSAADPTREDLSEAGSGTAHIHELCEREHCGCNDGACADGEATVAACSCCGHELAPAAQAEPHTHESCHHDAHAHGGSMLRSVAHGAVVHTVQVTGFIFLVTLALTAVMDAFGEDAIAAFLSSNVVAATFASGLVGLIPNCAASVVITQLYLEGALALGPMMAGSLVAAGAGFLVLFRTNANARENVCILGTLYVIGVVCGLALAGLGL